MKLCWHLAILFLYTTTVVAEDIPSKAYYWNGLFVKLNTILEETDKINQKLLDLDQRFVELNTRQGDLESKITKLFELADSDSKYLSEIRLDINKRQDDQADQMLHLVENLNSNSISLNKSLVKQVEQGNQIIKLRETVDLATKYINESRLEYNKSLDAPIDMIEKTCKSNHTWTTILRRQDGSIDFYRKWLDYQKGFGNPPDGEFFIGLNKLYEILNDSPHELLIVLKDWKNEMRYAYYDDFNIGGEYEKYALTVLGEYSGNAGDGLKVHKRMKFSTFDQDNDHDSRNCAKYFKGAWWFKACYHCHLNGPYRQELHAESPGVSWDPYKLDYSLKFAEMKIRPKFL